MMKVNLFFLLLLINLSITILADNDLVKIKPIKPKSEMVDKNTIKKNSVINIAGVTDDNAPKTLDNFTSGSNISDNSVYLYCECERWASCRKNDADKIFIKLYKSEKPKFEIAVTPGDLEFSYDLPLTELSKSGTYQGLISPLLVQLNSSDASYQASYLDPKRDSRNIIAILDRKDLKLKWGSYNYHQCEVVNESDFKTITNKVINSGLKKFIRQTNKRIDKKIKQNKQRLAEEALRNRPNKI